LLQWVITIIITITIITIIITIVTIAMPTMIIIHPVAIITIAFFLALPQGVTKAPKIRVACKYAWRP